MIQNMSKPRRASTDISRPGVGAADGLLASAGRDLAGVVISDKLAGRLVESGLGFKAEAELHTRVGKPPGRTELNDGEGRGFGQRGWPRGRCRQGHYSSR